MAKSSPILSVGLCAHHLIMFARGCLRGRGNASHYSAKARGFELEATLPNGNGRLPIRGPFMLAALMLEGLPPNGATMSCGLSATRRRHALSPTSLSKPLIRRRPRRRFRTSAGHKQLDQGSLGRRGLFRHRADEANGSAPSLPSSRATPLPAPRLSLKCGSATWVATSLADLSGAGGAVPPAWRHDRRAVAANDIAIEIEAALAFGTGHHGSTRGVFHAGSCCAAAAAAAILDLGTGSGVLAIGRQLFKRAFAR